MFWRGVPFDGLMSFADATESCELSSPLLAISEWCHAFGGFEYFDEVSGIGKTAVDGDVFDRIRRESECRFGMRDSDIVEVINQSRSVETFIFAREMIFAHEECLRQVVKRDSGTVIRVKITTYIF